MTIPTQMSLYGFIASSPQLSFTGNGIARFYSRIGVEHFRKESDGSFIPLDLTFHGMVLYWASAYANFHKGDSFVASGYTNKYETEINDRTQARDQFVARRIGQTLLAPGMTLTGRRRADPTRRPTSRSPRRRILHERQGPVHRDLAQQPRHASRSTADTASSRPRNSESVGGNNSYVLGTRHGRDVPCTGRPRHVCDLIPRNCYDASSSPS